jgi:hypothetical protein
MSLFNDAVSNSDCVALKDLITLNNELEKMWKVIFRHLHADTEEKHEES